MATADSTTETRPGMPNPARALREIADIAPNPRIKQLAREMADELDRQHRKQNDEFTAALVDTSLTWQDDLRALRRDVAQLAETVEAGMKIGATHRAELEHKIDRELAAMRDELRALQRDHAVPDEESDHV